MGRIRFLLVPFLALQLAASVRSAEALMLCIAADGRASIEFAGSSSQRCGDCAPTDAADHPCRDLVILSGVAELAPASATSLPPPVVVPAVMQPPPSGAAGNRSEARTALARSGPTEHRRCIVLTI